MQKFVEKNKDKIIIGTGDALQLKPIQELSNIKDYHTYADEIIDDIFNFKINLKISKRLNSGNDRDKIHQIKHDIFVNKLSLKKLLTNTFHIPLTLQVPKIILLS